MRRLFGEYDENGYRIFDGQTGQELYAAGNHPGDSQTHAAAPLAVALEVLALWCDQTGRQIAQEHGALWVGCQQADPQEEL